MSVGQPGPTCPRCNQVKELYMWKCSACGSYWSCRGCAARDYENHKVEREQGRYARSWQNDEGKYKWQPLLPNGQGLWMIEGLGNGPKMREWCSRKPINIGSRPILYRSRKRAIRVARREEKRRTRYEETSRRKEFQAIYPPLPEPSEDCRDSTWEDKISGGGRAEK